MSGKFSAALKLGDLNDFIAPSQACAVSLNGNKKNNPPEDGLVQIQERTKIKRLDTEPVKVTLHDCLACSGCITSAETVMLEQQSIDEFMKQVSSEETAVIVSVSPQSRASLACYYGITPLQALKKLTTFFKKLGVKAVFDISCSRDMSLVESCEEFVKKYKAQSRSQNKCQSKDFPLLASSCPGWVCYAEKTLDSSILPHISSVKSPQQTMGAIIKRFACSNLGLMLTNVDEAGHLYGSRGGSGGYAECIFRYAAHVLFDKQLPSHLDFKTLRNSDFKELTLEVEGEVVLRFACCYGFRNIQNLVRKVKAGKCEYHFVEIMACPSGCLNGGGQIKPKKGQSGKDLIQSLESAYLNEVDVSNPFDNPIIKGLYSSWLDHPGSEKSLEIMHTGYHTREKSVSSQLSNW